jgi:hypothetical protein
MPLSVSIDSVTLAGSQGVRVAGGGSPDGASVTVHVQINGDGAGNGATVVGAGQWSTVVMIQNVSAGQTGSATATATSIQFPGQQAQAMTGFTL